LAQGSAPCAQSNAQPVAPPQPPLGSLPAGTHSR
jgi:hypothetical protein